MGKRETVLSFVPSCTTPSSSRFYCCFCNCCWYCFFYNRFSLIPNSKSLSSLLVLGLVYFNFIIFLSIKHRFLLSKLFLFHHNLLLFDIYFFFLLLLLFSPKSHPHISITHAYTHLLLFFFDFSSLNCSLERESDELNQKSFLFRERKSGLDLSLSLQSSCAEDEP